MRVNGPGLRGAILLAIGVALGWGLAGSQSGVLRASSADRNGESILLSGPTLVRYDDALRAPIAHDAIYYLDYKGGRLLATVPSFRGTLDSSKLLDTFSERDLVADFKLDTERGPRPRFLMTTGALGTRSDGWSPLYVFEATTNQVAVYRVQTQIYGVNTRPQFDLLQVRPIAMAPDAAAAR